MIMPKRDRSSSLRHSRIAAWIALVSLISGLIGGLTNAAAAESIPVTGCLTDGQMGPGPAPADGAAPVKVQHAIAARLAYYAAADGQRLLAPRGWHCRQWVSSSASELIVAPGAIESAGIRSPSIAGQGVSLSLFYGSTSGRFTVAKYVEQLFPGAEKAFVSRVKRELNELPEMAWKAQNYPFDVYSRPSPTTLEFRTPGHRDGMGTTGALAKSAEDVRGTVLLRDPDGDEPDLTILRVRLPEDLRELEVAVLHGQP
jgi:hypothetical protein